MNMFTSMVTIWSPYPHGGSLADIACTYDHSLVNMSSMRLHLLHNCGEFVKKLLICIQGEQVFLSEQETKSMTLRPTQAVTRRCSHSCDGVLNIHHRVQLAWTWNPWHHCSSNDGHVKSFISARIMRTHPAQLCCTRLSPECSSCCPAAHQRHCPERLLSWDKTPPSRWYGSLWGRSRCCAEAIPWPWPAWRLAMLCSWVPEKT